VKPAITTPRYKPPLPGIKLGSSDRTNAETRWGTYLVWFMRAVSVLWLLQGVAHWFSVLAPDADPQGSLATMTSMGIAAVMFFSVIDLIAAVGLWLAAAWGGVVWLVAVAGQWIATLILPGFFAYDILTSLGDAVLVGVYFYFTYRAARENEPYV
jgi:hypothetical protein